MTTADWYFDFVSPFSYLQWRQRERLEARLTLRCRPIVFGAVLNHWNHKGPAELPTKRRHTYRQVLWLAERLGVPLRFPPAHPFKPLRALRLALALDCRPQAIDAIFDAIWRNGEDLDRPETWRQLTAEFGLEDPDAAVADASVKQQLRANTEEAITRGVFGVPTLIIDDELFWGLDSTDMALDYLLRPEVFRSAEMQRIDRLPEGVRRQ